jgi:hypothetical protein
MTWHNCVAANLSAQSVIYGKMLSQVEFPMTSDAHIPTEKQCARCDAGEPLTGDGFHEIRKGRFVRCGRLPPYVAEQARPTSNQWVSPGFLAALDRESGDGFYDETCQTAARVIRSLVAEVERLQGEIAEAENDARQANVRADSIASEWAALKAGATIDGESLDGDRVAVDLRTLTKYVSVRTRGVLRTPAEHCQYCDTDTVNHFSWCEMPSEKTDDNRCDHPGCTLPKWIRHHTHALGNAPDVEARQTRAPEVCGCPYGNCTCDDGDPRPPVPYSGE